MIVEILLVIFKSVFSTIISVLPSPSSLPVGLSTSLDHFSSEFAKLNVFLPIDTGFACLAVLFTLEGGILLFKIFNYAINKLRGSG